MKSNEIVKLLRDIASQIESGKVMVHECVTTIRSDYQNTLELNYIKRSGDEQS